jgi:hypothetical protein
VLKVIPIKLKRAWEANTTVIVVSKGGLFGHLFCLDKFGKNNLWSPDTSHRVVQRMILTAFGMAVTTLVRRLAVFVRFFATFINQVLA